MRNMRTAFSTSKKTVVMSQFVLLAFAVALVDFRGRPAERGTNMADPVKEGNVPDSKRAMMAGAKEVEFRVGKATFVLVRIPAGEFNMGSPASEEGHMASESPVRHVRISKAFYLGRFEVTQLQYKEVIGTDAPSRFHGDSLPVEGIHYREAHEFCRRLSERVGVPITLPTEAQWEYACRAGTKTRYYSGDNLADLDKAGWYRENSGGTTHPVGQKQANAWGLYDMHGNVWELCADLLEGDYHDMLIDPKGKMNITFGGMRGGGWCHPAEDCRSATRSRSDDMFGGMGIRIAVNP